MSVLILTIFPPLSALAQAKSVAGITVDESSANGGQIGLAQSSNGAVLVNIAAANGSGLSHNQFISFSVDGNGAVLNNATVGTVNNTAVAGVIPGNPNMGNAGQQAQVILNEVTSSNKSELKGFLEVAGQQASVIVANPNGILCDGCGFVNTPHATITTGTARIDGGALAGFDVERGQIEIGRGGLNASDVDVFDIVSRSVFLDGAVVGKTLRVLAGRNATTFSADGDTIAHTPLAATAGSPEFAIDSTSFGGIYGGQVSMVATEAGVGVRARADMVSNVGGVALSADGTISFANLNAAGGVSAKSGSGSVSGGNVTANADILLDSSNSISVNAVSSLDGVEIEAQSGDIDFETIAANGNVTVTAHSGQVLATLVPEELNVNVYSGKTVSVTAGDAIEIARTVAQQSISFLSASVSAELLEARDGDADVIAQSGNIEASSVIAQGNISVDAQAGNVTAGLLTAAEGVTLRADNGSSRVENIAANGVVDVRVKDSFGGVAVAANEKVIIEAHDVASMKVTAGDTLDVKADGSFVANEVISGKKMDVTADLVVAGTVRALDGDASITVDTGFTSNELISGGETTLKAGAGEVAIMKLISKNTAGIIGSKVNITESIVGLDFATYAETGVMNFVEGADLEVTTREHGAAKAQDQVVLGDVLSSGSTMIEANGDVSYGSATTGRDIAIFTEGDVGYGATDTGGHFRIKADGDLDFSYNSLLKQAKSSNSVDVGGVIDLSGNSIKLNNSEYTFAGFYADAKNDLDLNSTRIVTERNEAAGNGNIVLSAANVKTDAATDLDAAGSIILSVDSAFYQYGSMTADGDIMLFGDKDIYAGYSGGDISAGGSVMVGKLGEDNAVLRNPYFVASGGKISADQGNIVLMVDNLGDTSAGEFETKNGDIFLSANSGSSWQGTFKAENGLVSIDLAQGHLYLAKNVNAETIQLFSQNTIQTSSASALDAKKDIIIGASVNDEGVMSRVATFTADGAVSTQDGSITIAATSLSNNKSIAATGGDIVLDTAAIYALGDVQTANGDLRVRADTSLNFSKALNIDGELIAQSAAIDYGSGVGIEAKDSIVLFGGIDEDGDLNRAKTISGSYSDIVSREGDIVLAAETTTLHDVRANDGGVLIESDYTTLYDIESLGGSTVIQAIDQFISYGSITSADTVQVTTDYFYATYYSSDTNVIKAKGDIVIAGGADENNELLRSGSLSGYSAIESEEGSVTLAADYYYLYDDIKAAKTAYIDMGYGYTYGIDANDVVVKASDYFYAYDDVTAQGGIVALTKSHYLYEGKWTAGEKGILLAGDIDADGTVSRAGYISKYKDFASENGGIIVMGGDFYDYGKISTDNGSINLSVDNVYDLSEVEATNGSVVFSALDNFTVYGAKVKAGDQIALFADDAYIDYYSTFDAAKDIFISRSLDEEGRMVRAEGFTNYGNLTSSAGEVVLVSDNVANYGTLNADAGGIAVRANTISSLGAVNVAKSMHFHVDDKITLSENLNSNEQITLLAAHVDTGSYDITAASYVLIAGDEDPDLGMIAASSVTSSGTVTAKTGDVIIGADSVTNYGHYKADTGDVVVLSTDIGSLGDLSALEGNINVQASESVNVTGDLVANNFASILAPSISGSTGSSIDATDGILIAGGFADIELADGEMAPPIASEYIALNTEMSSNGAIDLIGNAVSNTQAISSTADNVRIFADGDVSFAGLSALSGFVEIQGANVADLNGDISAGDFVSVYANEVDLDANVTAVGAITFAKDIDENNNPVIGDKFDLYGGTVLSTGDNVVILANNVSGSYGVVRSEGGVVYASGQNLSGSNTYASAIGDVTLAFDQSINLASGSQVDAGNSALLLSEDTYVNGAVTAANDVLLAASIDDEFVTTNAAKIGLGSSGNITSENANVFLRTDSYDSYGQVTALAGAIELSAGTVPNTGSLSAKEALFVNVADGGSANVNGVIRGGDGTGVFSEVITVASNGQVKGGNGNVYLGRGIDEEGALTRAVSITNAGYIDGEDGEVQIIADTINSTGTIRSGNQSTFLEGGYITMANASGADISLDADYNISLIGSVAASQIFSAKSAEGSIAVGNQSQAANITAASLSLVSPGAISVTQSVLDARGSAEFGIKGDLFLESGSSVSFASKFTQTSDNRSWGDGDNGGYDNRTHYKNNSSIVRSSNDVGIFTGENAGLTLNSSQIEAGNGVVMNAGYVQLNANKDGTARNYANWSTHRRCTAWFFWCLGWEVTRSRESGSNSAGIKSSSIKAGVSWLASREALDADVLNEINGTETDEGIANFREAAGAGNVVVTSQGSITGTSPMISTPEYVSLYSVNGNVSFTAAQVTSSNQSSWNQNGHILGIGGSSSNNSSGSFSSYISGSISGGQGVQIMAPNGTISLESMDISSELGSVSLAANFIELTSLTNTQEVIKSSNKTGFFYSSSANEYSYTEATDTTTIRAGQDLLISGTSGVLLDTVSLQAAENINILAGYDMDGELVMENAAITIKARKNVQHSSKSSSETGLFVGSSSGWFSLYGHQSESTEAWMENVDATKILAGGGASGEGGNITLLATGDIHATAVQIAGEGDVNLQSVNGDVTLTTIVSESWMKRSKSNWSVGIGAQLPDFASSSTFTITAGLQASNQSTNIWRSTHVGSGISAGTQDNEGDVTIISGGDTTIEGSIIKATGDIGITADGTISILDVHNQMTVENYQDSTFVGFTIGLNNPVIDKIQGAYAAYLALEGAIEAVGGDLAGIDDPLSAISGAASIANVFNASLVFGKSLQDLQKEIKTYAAFVKQDEDGLKELTLLNINASFGVNHSSSSSTTTSTMSSGSKLIADGDVSINTALDFNFFGSSIDAGGDVGITAGGDINIQNGTNTSDTVSNENEFGFSVGLTASVNGLLQGSIGSFYGKANFSVTNGNSGSVTAVPATISGTNVTLEADGSITGVGAQISGENIFLTAGEDISFIAAQNSSYSNGSTVGANFGVNVPVGPNLAPTGFSFNLGANFKNNSSSTLTNVNSSVIATNLLQTSSGGDTNLIGAVFAGNDVIVDVGGNLNIQSLQDTVVANSGGFGFGVNLGTDKNFKPTSFGFNFGVKGKTASMAMVNQQSGIFGNDSVKVDVEGNTNLVGGVINATSGNLELTTGSLTFSNIYDHNYSFGGSFGTGQFNYEFGGDKTLAQNLAEHFNLLDGKWTAGFEFLDIRQTTNATVGAGNITITGGGSVPEGLNRNIALAQQITSNIDIDASSLLADIRAINNARKGLIGLVGGLLGPKKAGKSVAAPKAAGMSVAAPSEPKQIKDRALPVSKATSLVRKAPIKISQPVSGSPKLGMGSSAFSKPISKKSTVSVPRFGKLNGIKSFKPAAIKPMSFSRSSISSLRSLQR